MSLLIFPKVKWLSVPLVKMILVAQLSYHVFCLIDKGKKKAKATQKKMRMMILNLLVCQRKWITTQKVGHCGLH